MRVRRFLGGCANGRGPLAVLLAAAAVALLGALLAAPCAAVPRGNASSPESLIYGKSLKEWMQLYWTWAFAGGEDQADGVKFLPLPSGEYLGGNFTYDDPGILAGEMDVAFDADTPFALPVVGWAGETYVPGLYDIDEDPAIPPKFFIDPDKATIKVYIDGEPVMDSTLASVSPFYYGPAKLDVPYEEPSGYGSTGIIFCQGIGFVHAPLTEGVHTIELESEVRIPADPEFLNLEVYPGGSGVRFVNTWTITVSP